MNENHALCATPEWAEFMEHDVLEPVTAGVDLGGEMLELGPGPGAATRWLRHRVERLVALELDEESGRRLADELAGTNVTVEIGDSTNLPFPNESFDSVACFTMLHHVPTQQEQFATLREAFRVLRTGGALVGADSLASQGSTSFTKGTHTTRSTLRGCSSSSRRPASATSWSRPARDSCSPRANRQRKGVESVEHDPAVPGTARTARAG